MEVETPEEKHQNYCIKIAKEILNKDFIPLTIEQFILHENTKKNKSSISCCLVSPAPHFVSRPLNGVGEGVVDALFGALVDNLAGTYLSLQQVEFEDFTVVVKFKESARRTKTDAPVEIRLTIKTSRFNRVHFRHQCTSMVSAAVEVMRQAVEFFINLECAILQLYNNVKDAEKRNRQDLISEYTYKMANLVEIISYEKTLEKRKQDKL